MKKTLKILSLLMALMLVLAVFAGCQPNGNNSTTTTPEEVYEGKVTVYWMQGQKELDKNVINAGETVSAWTPNVEGKELVGWYSDPGCTKKFDFTQKITQDTEIFAKFKNSSSSGGTEDDEVVEDATWYLVGTGVGSLSVSNWDQKNKVLGMEDIGDGSYTITIDFYAGDKFQICTGGTWDYQKGLGYVVDAQLVEGSDSEGEVRDAEGNVIFTGTKEFGNPIEKWNITLAPGYDGKYEFTFNEIENTITWKLISKLDPKDPSEGGMDPLDSTYTVAGTSNLCGSEWDVSDTNNDMTLANGVYTITYEDVPAGYHEFKIAVNHDWAVSYGNEGANVQLNLDAVTTVVITFDPNTTAITIKDGNGNVIDGSSSAPEIGDDAVYSVAGTAGLCGTEWDIGNTANDMTLVNGVYTITYENVAAGEHAFKVVANHSWNNAYGDPNNSDYNNIVIYLSAASNVTITFNPATATVTAKDGEGNVLFGSSEPSDTPVVGEPASVVYLVPGSWNGLCAAWCWVSGSDGSWVTLTDKDNDGVYECEVPEGCNMIIFAHFGDAMEAVWDTELAKTLDMSIPAAPGVYYHADTNTWSAK